MFVASSVLELAWGSRTAQAITVLIVVAVIGSVSRATIINAAVATLVIIQSLAQCAAIVVLRHRQPNLPRLYRQWLYPLQHRRWPHPLDRLGLPLPPRAPAPDDCRRSAVGARLSAAYQRQPRWNQGP